jgi:hypothetical protein
MFNDVVLPPGLSSSIGRHQAGLEVTLDQAGAARCTNTLWECFGVSQATRATEHLTIDLSWLTCLYPTSRWWNATIAMVRSPTPMRVMIVSGRTVRVAAGRWGVC